MRIALAQIAPHLGDLDANLTKHLDAIAAAREQEAQVVCFPELSLTGYYLRDLTAAVAVRPETGDRIFRRLLDASKDMDIVVGFVEETPRFLFYNSAAYLAGGKVLHIHRKVYLPTYGMFDEERFMATGNTVRVFATSFGNAALLICEDLWHLSLPYLAWVGGADYLIGLVSSPGRGVHAGSPRFASSESWEALATALARFFTSYVVFVNRVGFEDGVSFFGGSLAVGPSGRSVAHAPDLEEALIIADLDPLRLRRERIKYPLLRDERPDLTLRELTRIVGSERGAVSSKQ